MKCIIGLVILAVGAMDVAMSSPVRNGLGNGGMVFYQTQPDYYNAHRAFLMQYMQPVKAYRRNGQAAAGVTAYASGKKIGAGTYIKREFVVNLFKEISLWNNFDFSEETAEQLTENDEQNNSDTLDGAVQSIAEAYDDSEHNQDDEGEQTSVASVPLANDVPEDIPEVPVVHFVPQGNKKTPVQLDEDDDEDDDIVPVRANNRGASGSTFFPVSFGSTNGGAIAIANSYSTGKGEQLKVWFLICILTFSLKFHPRGGSGTSKLKKMFTWRRNSIPIFFQHPRERPHTVLHRKQSDELQLSETESTRMVH